MNHTGTLTLSCHCCNEWILYYVPANTQSTKTYDYRTCKLDRRFHNKSMFMLSNKMKTDEEMNYLRKKSRITIEGNIFKKSAVYRGRYWTKEQNKQELQ